MKIKQINRTSKKQQDNSQLHMLDYSFQSDSISRNLSKLQEEIIEQYKRLGFGEDTIEYSINSLNNEDLPQNFPEDILRFSKKCFRLANCGFFQMLTYAVWEFLLQNKTNQKNDIVKKIRKLIAEKDFMEDCPSTKGLLVKGIKMMNDHVELSKQQKPVAHCMWKNDSMMAFTEFWKALLAKLSVKNIVIADTSKDLDVGLFQLLADFLEISFNIYYESFNEFQKEIYECKKKKNNLTLSIVVYSSSKKKVRDCSRILNSSAMTEKSSILQSLEWHYVIVQDATQYYKSQLERGDISQIERLDESVQDEKEELMRLFKCKTKSQMQLQKLGHDLHTGNQDLASPYNSRIKDRKGLETTRTKKSGGTTEREVFTRNRQFSGTRYEMIPIQETENHLSSIRQTVSLGENLIKQLNEFCTKIKA